MLTINISNTVTFEDLTDGTQLTVKIVSSIESDPLSNPDNIKVSNECPLGAALIGHKIGDEVTVKANPDYKVKIIDFK